PNTEVMETGRYVVFFLGLAQVWDMMTGVNNEIIAYSRHYRFTLYLTLLLAVVNIVANLYFIPRYGLTGAAMATCLSLFLYNVVKLVFIRVKMGLQPFTMRLIPVLTFAAAAWLLARWVPESDSAIITLMVKGAVFTTA